jgi:hypothetical protein
LPRDFRPNELRGIPFGTCMKLAVHRKIEITRIML